MVESVTVNKNWYDPNSIKTLSSSCSPDLEHITILCYPFHLPWEFTSVIINAVYIPPQADTHTTLSGLHDVLCQSKPDTQTLPSVAGDFNKANSQKGPAELLSTRHVPHQREQHTGPLLNTIQRGLQGNVSASIWQIRPCCTIFLMPKYKQRMAQEKDMTRQVRHWNDQLKATLQDALIDVDRDMFQSSSRDVNKFPELRLFCNAGR